MGLLFADDNYTHITIWHVNSGRIAKGFFPFYKYETYKIQKSRR